jgi:hypothetical protein
LLFILVYSPTCSPIKPSMTQKCIGYGWHLLLFSSVCCLYQ